MTSSNTQAGNGPLGSLVERERDLAKSNEVWPQPRKAASSVGRREGEGRDALLEVRS